MRAAGPRQYGHRGVRAGRRPRPDCLCEHSATVRTATATLATLKGHTDFVVSAVFVPDGNSILTPPTTTPRADFPEVLKLIDNVKTEVPRCLIPYSANASFSKPLAHSCVSGPTVARYPDTSGRTQIPCVALRRVGSHFGELCPVDIRGGVLAPGREPF